MHRTGGQIRVGFPREKREKSPKAGGEQRASGEKPQGWRWGGAPAGADCGRWSQRPSGACAKVLQPPHSPRTGFLGLGISVLSTDSRRQTRMTSACRGTPPPPSSPPRGEEAGAESTAPPPPASRGSHITPPSGRLSPCRGLFSPTDGIITGKSK